MDIRPLTPDYAVSPQIDPEDLPAIAAQGYKTVIDNRPCTEVPPSHQAEAMAQAARAAGVTLVVLPVTHQTLNAQTVARQQEAIAAADGPVLAYCASGTRSSIVWALGQAGHMATDDILSAAADQGYDLTMIRPQLDGLAANP